MKTRQFGCSKRQVAVIGQGTCYSARDEREAAIAALRRGLDLGMTHIDTGRDVSIASCRRMGRRSHCQTQNYLQLDQRYLQLGRR